MANETIAVVFEPLGFLPGTATIYYHETLLYTDASGQKFIASCFATGAGPDGPVSGISSLAKGATGSTTSWGLLACIAGSITAPEIMNTLNVAQLLAPSNPTTVVATGADLSQKWNQIVTAEQEITNQQFSYSPLTLNSNSAANTALKAADITPPADIGIGDSHWAPAGSRILPTSGTAPSSSQSINEYIDEDGNAVVTVSDLDQAGATLGSISIALSSDEGAASVGIDANGDGVVERQEVATPKASFVFTTQSDGTSELASVNKIGDEAPLDPDFALLAVRAESVTPRVLLASNGSIEDLSTLLTTFDATDADGFEAPPAAAQASDGNTLASGISSNQGTAIGQNNAFQADLNSTLSLIRAVKAGNPLAIATSGLNLANYLSNNHDAALVGAGGALNVLSGTLGLKNALERGDPIAAAQAGLALTSQALSLYVTVSLQPAIDVMTAQINAIPVGQAVPVDLAASYNAALEARQAIGSTTTSINQALPYINVVLSLAQGDAVGAAVAIAVIAFDAPVIGWIYAGLSILDALFGDDDPPVPHPVGTAQFIHTDYATNGIAAQMTANQDAGGEAALGLANQMLNLMNQQVAGLQNAGLIVERLPSVVYSEGTILLHIKDPVTGADVVKSFDALGNSTAQAGTEDYFDSLSMSFYKAAVAAGAIAPQWEVETNLAQAARGAPGAGLNTLQRAAQEGNLITPSGATQAFVPIVLDLDGNGVNTIAQAAGGVLFDVDTDGYAEATDWINPRDGILALDRDGSGQIDSGRDLFSEARVASAGKGLHALVELDANGDGVIDASDPVFAQLRVWRDVNLDRNIIRKYGLRTIP